jgi:hypothetical protein
MLAATLLPALAAPPAPPGPPDPLDPAAAVPRLEYRSALRGYRPLADTPPGDWRALNDQVHRVGGWRTYLRQAHAPEPAASTPAAPPAATPSPAVPAPAAASMPAPSRPAGQPNHHHHHHHGGRP